MKAHTVSVLIPVYNEVKFLEEILARLKAVDFCGLGKQIILVDDGSTDGTRDILHRIDQDEVRREVESVGFVYDGESQMLRNPQDPRTANVFDPSIRGHTDQFFLRFRKPG